VSSEGKMADSLGQNWKNRDFTLASVSDLSSDASSPGIARFTSDALQIHPESPQIPLNFDLRTAQVPFSLFPLFLSFYYTNSVNSFNL
jgi:histone-arginine methyltransferase CARM1